MKYGLALHGGAGTILPEALTSEKKVLYGEALLTCLEKGTLVLEKGGSALDVVQETVKALENCELFNAGKGAVFTHQGGHEMDACIMDGTNGLAGAVAGVTKVKNPILLARLVMEKTDFVILHGKGAEELAEKFNLPLEPNSYFDTTFRKEQWDVMKHKDSTALDHSSKMGTVGAVCLDKKGRLAAATSTGGMTNKRYQRIGDSPIPGAGTWAAQETCAISCTGHGEFFIREVVAHQIHMRMSLLGESLTQASQKVVMEHLQNKGGEGGLIGIDKEGVIAMPFNSTGMYRAWYSENNAPQFEIF